MFPCDWPVTYREDCLPEEWTSEDQETFEALAAEYLWNWTGRIFGVCEVVLRPCSPGCATPLWSSTFEGRGPFGSQSTRYLMGSSPVSLAQTVTHEIQEGLDGEYSLSRSYYLEAMMPCGTCRGCQRLNPARVLTLKGPVDFVSEVKVDGDVLPSTAYRLSGNLLIRQDGENWPLSQNFDAPATAAGTWQVTYERGIPVPVGGQVATGILAVELWKAACGDKSCALPQRVQSITRQGVTVAVLDAFDDIDKGHTGIWLIDSWIASVTRSPRPSVVLSPDLPR